MIIIKIKSALKKILNSNEEHLDYYLSILGYSMIGEPDLEKKRQRKNIFL